MPKLKTWIKTALLTLGVGIGIAFGQEAYKPLVNLSQPQYDKAVGHISLKKIDSEKYRTAKWAKDIPRIKDILKKDFKYPGKISNYWLAKFAENKGLEFFEELGARQRAYDKIGQVKPNHLPALYTALEHEGVFVLEKLNTLFQETSIYPRHDYWNYDENPRGIENIENFAYLCKNGGAELIRDLEFHMRADAECFDATMSLLNSSKKDSVKTIGRKISDYFFEKFTFTPQNTSQAITMIDLGIDDKLDLFDYLYSLGLRSFAMYPDIRDCLIQNLAELSRTDFPKKFKYFIEKFNPNTLCFGKKTKEGSVTFALLKDRCTLSQLNHFEKHDAFYTKLLNICPIRTSLEPSFLISIAKSGEVRAKMLKHAKGMYEATRALGGSKRISGHDLFWGIAADNAKLPTKNQLDFLKTKGAAFWEKLKTQVPYIRGINIRSLISHHKFLNNPIIEDIENELPKMKAIMDFITNNWKFEKVYSSNGKGGIVDLYNLSKKHGLEKIHKLKETGWKQRNFYWRPEVQNSSVHDLLEFFDSDGLTYLTFLRDDLGIDISESKLGSMTLDKKRRDIVMSKGKELINFAKKYNPNIPIHPSDINRKKDDYKITPFMSLICSPDKIQDLKTEGKIILEYAMDNIGLEDISFQELFGFKYELGPDYNEIIRHSLTKVCNNKKFEQFLKNNMKQIREISKTNFGIEKWEFEVISKLYANYITSWSDSKKKGTEISLDQYHGNIITELKKLKDAKLKKVNDSESMYQLIWMSKEIGAENTALLYNKFNITHPKRFTKRGLEDQIKLAKGEIKLKKPPGIFVVTQHEDGVFRPMLSNLKRIFPENSWILYEAGKETEFTYSIKDAYQTYNEIHKLAIGGHGYPAGTMLDKKYQDEYILDIHDEEELQKEKLYNCMAKNGLALLISCFTGWNGILENNMGNMTARVFRTMTSAPDQAASLATVIRDRDNSITYITHGNSVIGYFFTPPTETLGD